jgi:hypothetical protein
MAHAAISVPVCELAAIWFTNAQPRFGKVVFL